MSKDKTAHHSPEKLWARAPKRSIMKNRCDFVVNKAQIEAVAVKKTSPHVYNS